MAKLEFGLACFAQLSSKSQLMLGLSWKGKKRNLKQYKTKKNKLKEDVA
jgi:hypothetical protein